MTTKQLIENVIEARAAEIAEFVSMDMPLEWAIEYVKNSTTLSPKSIEQVIIRAKEIIESR